MCCQDTYQHIKPELVGNHRRILISELSGRGNIMSKIEVRAFGLVAAGVGPRVDRGLTGV